MTLTGIIHGNKIELRFNPGLPDGAKVEMELKLIPSKKMTGEGLIRSAGALADIWSKEDDAILEEIAQSRFGSSTRELPQ